MIYYIRCEVTGLVKVGTCNDKEDACGLVTRGRKARNAYG